MSDPRPIAEIKVKWWTWLLSLCPVFFSVLKIKKTQFNMRHGVRFRFYNEPWTQASKMGKQCDMYAFEVALRLQKEAEEGLNKLKNNKRLKKND